jgi:hypothetical protein
VPLKEGMSVEVPSSASATLHPRKENLTEFLSQASAQLDQQMNIYIGNQEENQRIFKHKTQTSPVSQNKNLTEFTP